MGLLAGLFGVGGGFILTPMLRLLFGVPYEVAVGSSLVQVVGTLLVSCVAHLRLGHVDLHLAMAGAAGSLAGAELGVRMQSWLAHGDTVHWLGWTGPAEDLVMTGLYVVLLCVVGVSMMRATAGRPGRPQPEAAAAAGSLEGVRIPPAGIFRATGVGWWALGVPAVLGAAVGVLTGLLGVGGGFVLYPILTLLLGLDPVRAAGTSSLQVLLSASYGALRHSMERNVDLWLVALLMAGSMGGARVGIDMVRKARPAGLRRAFGLLTLATAAFIVARLAMQG